MKPAILFVSYYYHPYLLTATRNFYLSKMLAEQGYEVHILGRATKEGIEYLPVNARFHDIQAWDYRRVLKLLGFRDGITSTKIKSEKFIAWGHRVLLRYPFNIILGEGGGGHYVKAIRAGKKLVKQYQIKYVYSSYRPVSDHFIAMNIKNHCPQIQWIGDFRDILWWTRADRHYQQSWIKKIIYSMDYMTAVTQGIADFWSGVYHRPVQCMYNGLPEINSGNKSIEAWKNKFVINYTGRIYTQFQRGDLLFLVLRELAEADVGFANDLLINYAGINKQHWQSWMQDFHLNAYAQSGDHLAVEAAWQFQANAQINILLTWTSKDINGFIHGKYNEYLVAGKPILCLVAGEPDDELKDLYAPLGNSLILTNDAGNKSDLMKFVLDIYAQWKSKGTVPMVMKSSLQKYDWKEVGRPLLELLNT